MKKNYNGKLLGIIVRSLIGLICFVSAGYGQVAPKPITKITPKVTNLPKLIMPELAVLRLIRTPNDNINMPAFYLRGKQKGEMYVQLDSTSKADITVHFKYSNPVLRGPGSVVIPRGQTFAYFDVEAQYIETSTRVVIEGWVVDIAKKKISQLEVKGINDPCNSNPQISIFTSPEIVMVTTSITITIQLNCPQLTATTVQISTSNPGLIPSPPSNVVIIPAGNLSASYSTIIGGNISGSTPVTIYAFIPGTDPINRAPDRAVVVKTL